MKTKTNVFKRVLAAMLTIAVLLVAMPLVTLGEESLVSAAATRVVDAATNNGWLPYFGPNNMTTQFAGGVWVDKSVFTDASSFPSAVTMKDPDNNFLVALSAIASNKEIVGYSTIPTDTVLVLDVSASMDAEADEMVLATNRAIESLLNTNKNNRVGVVLFSGSGSVGTSTYAQGTSVLLPLGRYTTTSVSRENIGSRLNPNYITVQNFLSLNNGTVSVTPNAVTVEGTSTQISASKAVSGGTYIQSGLWAAWKMFEKADTVVGDNNVQDGHKRMPILVLMGDGAPTVGTSNYSAVDSANSNVGRGTSSSATNAMAFLTQLTASYVLNRVEEHYDYHGGALFYTLGLGVGNDTVAMSVLDPANYTNTDVYWRNYARLGDGGSMQLTVPSTTDDDDTKNVSVTASSYATEKGYVDRYFGANNESQLIAAFQDIVNEIILQSRYYPTHLEGGSPDLSGYVEFRDAVGEYMEVKNINGVLWGETLFTGAMLTSKINSSADGLGTPTDPTELGHEFLNAVQTRLGITDKTDTLELVRAAWNAGQLHYENDTEFSNYIGWYATADGSYAGFYNEGVTTPPTGAVYANKSYGFLGEVGGKMKDSDMMYMSVQVSTHMETGRQTMIWKIPAALVPLVTYHVELDGNSMTESTVLSVTRTDATPVYLLFETGLQEEINELNVAEITDAKHISSEDGVTRWFWSNYWDNSAAEHRDHVTTVAAFTPSEQNERYYYTVDTPVYSDKNGTLATSIKEGNVYYHIYYVYSASSDKAIPVYEEISDVSLAKAVSDGKGGYYIPLGTPYRQLVDYRILKTENVTNSIHFSNYPYLTTTSASHEADAKLGNNGRLSVVPAQGIKLSKMLDAVEPNTSTTFRFRITLSAPSGTTLAETYPLTLAALNEVVGAKSTVTVTDGVIELDLAADQTAYITGLPTGTTYTVEEISDNTDYTVKTVHVNGEAVNGTVASGTVAAYTLDDVDFLNTPLGEGNLYISKTVEHPFGDNYAVPSALRFTARVTLHNATENVAARSFMLVTATGTSDVTTDANGVFTVSLRDGDTVSVHGLPEGTTYTVDEINLPDGFTLNTVASTGLTGTVADESTNIAHLVNTYVPSGVTPHVDVVVEKVLNGRDWQPGETYQFTLERLSPDARAVVENTVTLTVSEDGKTASYTLTKPYTTHGTYHYRLVEVADGKAGVTYDGLERRFRVEVADNDMDGKLEIVDVTNVMRTTVSGSAAAGYTVSTTFNNSYAPISGSSVTIPVQKQVENFGKNGFTFALYNQGGTEPVVVSSLSDGNGAAEIKLSFAATAAGKTFVYDLREVVGGIAGMTYDDTVYTVTVQVVDNGDGTTAASYTVTDASGTAVNIPTFTNEYASTEAVAVISGHKTLNGRVQNAGEFSFTLSGNGYIETVTNAYNGDFAFSPLTFSEEGVFVYTITETVGNIGGITYDQAVYTATVSVVGDNQGAYHATVTYTKDGAAAAALQFANTYTAKGTEVTLTADKILTGRDLADGEFVFVLKDAAGKEYTAKNNAHGNITFETIPYTAVGTYVYTLYEKNNGLGGVTYDSTVYTVTVTVSDPGYGELVAHTVITNNGAAVTVPVFRNTYTADPYTWTLMLGEKILEGRTLAVGEFAFELSVALSGQVLETVTNDENGNFTFAPRILRVANTYHYRITEVNDERGGVTYDTAIYDIVFTVVDNGHGELVLSGEPTITRNGVAENDLFFRNVYTATPYELKLQGTKVLVGRDPVDGEFEFVLFTEQGGGLDRVANQDGTFTFAPIEITAPGTYVYRVAEAAGDDATITYDETVYTVTVTVVDNGEGALVLDGDIVIDGGEAIVFTNTYTAPPADDPPADDPPADDPPADDPPADDPPADDPPADDPPADDPPADDPPADDPPVVKPPVDTGERGYAPTVAMVAVAGGLFVVTLLGGKRRRADEEA